MKDADIERLVQLGWEPLPGELPDTDCHVLFLSVVNGITHPCYGYRRDESNWADFEQVDINGEFDYVSASDVVAWRDFPDFFQVHNALHQPSPKGR